MPNSSDEAHLDVHVWGLLQGGHHAFFDVRVLTLSQTATHNRNLTWHSQMRMRKSKPQPTSLWSQAICSISPLLFLPYGRNGREAKQFFCELVLKLCEKEMNYGIAIHWLRARLSFYLLRSALLWVRGSRTLKHEFNTDFSRAHCKCD